MYKEGWSDGEIEGWRDRGMERQRDGEIEGWRDRRMERQRDGEIEGWKDGEIAGTVPLLRIFPPTTTTTCISTFIIENSLFDSLHQWETVACIYVCDE